MYVLTNFLYLMPINWLMAALLHCSRSRPVLLLSDSQSPPSCDESPLSSPNYYNDSPSMSNDSLSLINISTLSSTASVTSHSTSKRALRKL